MSLDSKCGNLLVQKVVKNYSLVKFRHGGLSKKKKTWWHRGSGETGSTLNIQLPFEARDLAGESLVKKCFLGQVESISWEVSVRRVLCQSEESKSRSLLSLLSKILFEGIKERFLIIVESDSSNAISCITNPAKGP